MAPTVALSSRKPVAGGWIVQRADPMDLTAGDVNGKMPANERWEKRA